MKKKRYRSFYKKKCYLKLSQESSVYGCFNIFGIFYIILLYCILFYHIYISKIKKFIDDVTRVILLGSASGDYINANYVNMEIPGSGIINRYIATQGPLSSTVADFWQMVLEAGSTLVVMLTTLVERGRAKCHQYWPALNETLTLRNLTLTSTAENVEDTFIFREFILRDINV